MGVGHKQQGILMQAKPSRAYSWQKDIPISKQILALNFCQNFSSAVGP